MPSLPRPVLQLSEDGRSIFLAGDGASPRGSHPFLDRLDVETGETARLWQCAEGTYEQVIALLDPAHPRLLTRYESPTEPPNYLIRRLGEESVLPLTHFAEPAPQLAGIRRQLLTYSRAGGVQLNATLITPPGYDP